MVCKHDYVYQLGGPYGGEVVLWTYFKYKTQTHIYIYNYIFIQIIIIHVAYNNTTNVHNSLELSHNPGKLGKILETTRTCSWGYKRATLPHLYLLPINQNHARICSLDSGIGSISTINLSSTKFPAVNIIFGGSGSYPPYQIKIIQVTFGAGSRFRSSFSWSWLPILFPGVPSGTACHFNQDQKKH